MIRCHAGLKRWSRGRASAFTLVELLVVVAIIGLLIAILIPALTSVRRQARLVNCQSNLGQIAFAWHAYLEEFRGEFLRGKTANTDYGGKQGSNQQTPTPRPLNKYLHLPPVTTSGADVFACPGDRDLAKFATTRGSTASRYCDFYGTSYFTNRFLIGPSALVVKPADPCYNLLTDMTLRLLTLTRSRIANESRLILVGDAGWDAALNVTSSDRVEWHAKPYSHNIGFMDGRAAFVRIRKGLHVTSEYTVVPLREYMAPVSAAQREFPPKP